MVVLHVFKLSREMCELGRYLERLKVCNLAMSV